MTKQIVRCISCDGFGWFEDEFSGAVEDCDWCAGVGYVYRDADNKDAPIPKADFDTVAIRLEELEVERLHDMGYEGQAKKPWQQDIRKDTNLGQNPYTTDDSDL